MNDTDIESGLVFLNLTIQEPRPGPRLQWDESDLTLKLQLHILHANRSKWCLRDDDDHDVDDYNDDDVNDGENTK